MSTELRPAVAPAQPTPRLAIPTVHGTTLTSDAEFRGALAFSGALHLNGRLEGTIESDGGTLTIGEEAVVKAEIKVNDLIVYGRVQGNMTAQGKIELRGQAQVYGDIRAARVMVEDGVTFVGRSETVKPEGAEKADFTKIFTRLPSTPVNPAAPATAAKVD